MNNTEQTEKKFTITVQRNQIAEVDIEVFAKNDSEAMDKAIECAEQCSDANGNLLDWQEVDYTFEGIDIEEEEQE